MQGYNITGLHVIDVRSLLQGSRLPRPSSSTTEDSFEDLALEPLFFEVISPLFLFFFSCSSGRSFAFFFYQVWTRVLIHIDNKIIGGSALENSDGVNLPVGWGDSILCVGCLSSCCLGVFIVGGGFFVCS